MVPSTRLLTTLVIACCLTGCLLPGAAKRPAGVAGSEGVVRGGLAPSKIGRLPSGDPASGVTPGTGSGIISNNGSGIISNASGSLSGFVKAPASLISNNGGSIISDNGLGYRLLADADVPFKRATVRLLDAAGNAVAGADGKALTATTDDRGFYTFKGVSPVSNLLLSVSLGERGQLQAIAPKSGAAERKSDLSVISTLTTRYILDQYVAGQADAQKTLDKLPSDVEAETRARAAAAFAASGQATPGDLKDATVRQVVTAMREKDTAFDAQMEKVKKLLVAAGLSDLGNGQSAVTVPLNAISQVLAAPDGSVYLYDGIVWRVTPEGMLIRVTAPGPADAVLAGKKASEAKLGPLKQVALDDQGRLWLLQDHPTFKLWRIEADGTLKDVGRGLSPLRLFTPTGGDGFLALTSPASWGQPVPLYECTGTAAPVLKHTFTGSDASVVFQFQQLARDGQGRLVGAGLMSVPKSYRFDFATNTLSLFKAAVVDGVGTVALDARGTLFYQMMSGGREVHMVAPDGTDAVVPGLTHLPITHGVSRGLDGRVFVTGLAQGASLYQVKAGQETLYAGKESQTGQTGNPATATALKRPTGLAVATDGTLYVTDDGALLRFHATEATTALVAAGSLTDGALAVEPVRPQMGPDGWVYFIGRLPFGTRTAFQGVWRVKAGGAPERVHTSDRHVEDYLLEADGALILAESTPPSTSGTTGRIVKRSAAGGIEPIVAEDQGLINSMALAKDAEGRLLLRGARKLGPSEFLFDRIFRVEGLEALPTTTFWPEARNALGDEVSGWYVSTPAIPKAVRRHKPATGVVEILTGPEGRFFTGSGVDDGVDTPQQPAFDGQGNLFFLDSPNKQVKRIPAADL
jgi:hypothetical protein